MSTSFRGIGQFMDSVAPATSLRRLFGIHRFVDGAAPSLRRIVDRHSDDRRRHRLLVYNAYLMPAIRVNISVDPLGVLPDIPKTLVPAKPALAERMREIGAMVAAEYDIAALCEVWNQEIAGGVLAGAIAAGRPGQLSTGKGRGQFLGDGKLVIALDGRPIGRIEAHMFLAKGRRDQDADWYAGKGVLMTEIDLGVGRIELYTVHIHSGGSLGLGGDWSKVANFVLGTDFRDPSEQEMQAVRIQQVRETVDFIRRMHRPENVVILAGDFNIDGHPLESWMELMAVLDELKPLGITLEDLWVKQAATNRLGYTNGDNSCIQRFAAVCATGPASKYCEEPSPAGLVGARLDYVFVQKPTPSHSFDLDCTRIRRRPFIRVNASENEYYMSDHLGLSLELVASARPPG